MNKNKSEEGNIQGVKVSLPELQEKLDKGIEKMDEILNKFKETDVSKLKERIDEIADFLGMDPPKK